ncbi:hypothetical protein M9H77_17248 [Catharanthus roseus]|uniref:Uncharacterized protein n=1 Tax=Catharanthus roseus TaxID=4058 RepID=A0ACC0B431_CATRO|nr:hypothetical protein M9H77_17248 [Catharanthus roseus]
MRERTNKTSITSRRQKVPLKGFENIKLLATLDILHPGPQEGLNKIFSSMFNQPKAFSPTSLHHNMNERKEKYHGVRRPRLLEHLWHGLKLLFVEISFKTLFERAFGFKFFLVHYKEFLFSKDFETQLGSNSKMSDTNICESFKSNEASFVLGIEDQRKSGGKLCGIGVFKNHFLNVKVQLKDPCDDQKLLTGLEDGLLVPNMNSLVISMKHEFSCTLLYHLPFKEFLKKFVCEVKFGKSRDFKSKQSYTFFEESLGFMSKSSWKKSTSNFFLDNLFIFNSIFDFYVDNILELSFAFASPCEMKSSWNFKKNFDRMRFHYVVIHESLLKDLVNESSNSHVSFKEMKSYMMRIHGWVLRIEKDESFRFRYPFKDYGFKACFKTSLTSVLFRSCLLNLFSQILEETFIVWNSETFSNFLFLTLQSFQDLGFYYHFPFKDVLRIDAIAWIHLHDILVHLCAYLERNHVKLIWVVPSFSLTKHNSNFSMHTCYVHHGPFKEDLNIFVLFPFIFQVFQHLRFYFHHQSNEVLETFDEGPKLQDFFHFNCVLFQRSLVTHRWHLCDYYVDDSSLNFFIYATFTFHKPFREWSGFF